MALSFTDYLNSLGAKSANIGYGISAATMNPFGLKYDQAAAEGGGQAYNLKGTPYYQKGFGGANADILPSADYDVGQQVALGGHGQRQGFLDSSGGFLGYGGTLGDVSNPQLQKQYSEYVAQDPIREQQVIANNAARAEAFEKERLLRQQYLQGLPTIGQTPQGASALTGIPGGTGQFGGFGGPMPGFGAQQQAQGGLLGGLHRGKFGGTGLLGGSGQ